MLTTVTTATMNMTAAAGDWLVAIAVAGLVVILVLKEIVSGMKGKSAEQLSRALNISLIPLVMVLFASLLSKVVQFL